MATCVSFIGACSDVTTATAQKTRSRENEERFRRAIFETNTDAVLMCDKQGKITFANHASELLIRHRRDSIFAELRQWQMEGHFGQWVSLKAIFRLHVLTAATSRSMGIEHAIEQNPSGRASLLCR